MLIVGHMLGYCVWLCACDLVYVLSRAYIASKLLLANPWCAQVLMCAV